MKRYLTVTFRVVILPLVVLGCGGPPRSDIGKLPTDFYGYLNAHTGQKLYFPVKDEKLSPEMFSLQDYFEVVGILGQPNQTEGELTNWAKNDVWFLLRSFRSEFPQFFILEVRSDGLQQNNPAAITKLMGMFNAGKFMDEAGRPIACSSGFFLYLCWQAVEQSEKDKDYKQYEQFFKLYTRLSVDNWVYKWEEISKDGFPLTVGESYPLPLNAKIFGLKESGKLIIVADESQPIINDYHYESGWHYTGYKPKVVLVRQEDVKCRPELEQVLPDPTDLWLGKPLIDWEAVETKSQK